MDRVPTRYGRSKDNANVMVDYEHSGKNQFILKDGKAYPVKPDGGQLFIYDPQNPEREAYPVRVEGDGQFEISTGLRGGAPKTYTDAGGKKVYVAYYLGGNYFQAARKARLTAHNAQAWSSQYAADHKLPDPATGAPIKRIAWMPRDEAGAFIYWDLQTGRSLQDVANEMAGGNMFATFRSAMRYAISKGVSVEPVVLARLRMISPASEEYALLKEHFPEVVAGYEGRGGSAAPVQPSTTPVGGAAFLQEGTSGPKRQRTPEPGTSQGDAQTQSPDPKRQRVDGSDPGTGETEQPARPASPPHEWGRNEVHDYIVGAQGLDPATSDAIYNWINGGPPPPGLRDQMNRDGFPDLTPDTVRDYFDPVRGRGLTTAQRVRVSRWLRL
jgi:hypothetical protein